MTRHVVPRPRGESRPCEYRAGATLGGPAQGAGGAQPGAERLQTELL